MLAFSQRGGRGGGGEGGRRGLGPRNEVLTTCKAVTLRGGQRIIAAFFPGQHFLTSVERPLDTL